MKNSTLSLQWLKDNLGEAEFQELTKNLPKDEKAVDEILQKALKVGKGPFGRYKTEVEAIIALYQDAQAHSEEVEEAEEENIGEPETAEEIETETEQEAEENPAQDALLGILAAYPIPVEELTIPNWPKGHDQALYIDALIEKTGVKPFKHKGQVCISFAKVYEV